MTPEIESAIERLVALVPWLMQKPARDAARALVLAILAAKVERSR